MQLMVELIGVEFEVSKVQKSLYSNEYYSSNDKCPYTSHHMQCCLWLPHFQLCILPKGGQEVLVL